MRIAVIIESFPVVSETFISNKVKFLHERGNDVFVFCNNSNDVLFEKIFGKNSKVTVTCLSIKNFVFYLLLHPWLLWKPKNTGPFKKYLFEEYRLRTINHYNCDILHFEFSGVGIAYLCNMDSLTGKKIISCRGTAENVNLALYKHRQQNIRKLFEKADAIHCVSEALKELILPYCVAPSKIFINRPAVDTTFFKKHDTKLAEEVPLILSVGRFIFQKGYFFGVLAMKKLKETGGKFKWIIVGDGMQYEEILFLVHKMQLEEHVALVGKKSMAEVIALYNKASIFFLPSVTEGIANVVLEAMSMELPVVSTRCGGMEEVITHEVNGLLSDVYDHEHLACNLSQLLKDKDLREKLGTAARETVTAKFDSVMQITRFEQVYRQLVMQKTTAAQVSYSLT